MRFDKDDRKLRAHIRSLLQRLHDESELSPIFAIFNAPSMPSLFTETIDDLLENSDSCRETFFPVGSCGGYYVKIAHDVDGTEPCTLLHRKARNQGVYDLETTAEYECRKRKRG